MNIRLYEVEPIVHKKVPSRGRAEVGEAVHQIGLQPVEVVLDFGRITRALRKAFVEGPKISTERAMLINDSLE